MNIPLTSMYVRKCEIDFLKFMNVSCLPNYTITPIDITQEEADSKGYAAPANVKYDFDTNTHHMSIWTIFPTLSADYIMFHEFTHMIDTERFCKSDKIKYIANKGYTEYHASQVALMKMLGAETIDSSLSFTMEQAVETYSGGKSVTELISTPLNTISEIINRDDFPADIGTISIVIGLAFNYYGYRSICQMFADNYTGSENTSALNQLLGDSTVKLLDKLMYGWFDNSKVAVIDNLCKNLIFSMLKEYKFM